MPRWLVLAARWVMSQYGGDAGAIWAGRPSADDLHVASGNFHPGLMP